MTGGQAVGRACGRCRCMPAMKPGPTPTRYLPTPTPWLPIQELSGGRVPRKREWAGAGRRGPAHSPWRWQGSDRSHGATKAVNRIAGSARPRKGKAVLARAAAIETPTRGGNGRRDIGDRRPPRTPPPPKAPSGTPMCPRRGRGHKWTRIPQRNGLPGRTREAINPSATWMPEEGLEPPTRGL
jgi:hypothetical protein